MESEKKGEKSEKVILSAKMGFQKMLDLTRDKLVVYYIKGIFNKRVVVEDEVPLNQIEEAYCSVNTWSGWSLLKLKLKNGEEKEFQLRESALGVFAGTAQLHHKALTDRWVNAINNQIRK